MQDEVHKWLILVFADMLDKQLRWELFSQFVGSQPVLRKHVIEFISNCKEEVERQCDQTVMNWHFSHSFCLNFLNTYDHYLSR